MNRSWRRIAGTVLAFALSSAGVGAQPAWEPAPAACCRAPAGAAVALVLADRLNAKTARAGDTFDLRLAAPLVADGQVVLPAGTPGVGEVITAAGPGLGGKPAKLVLAARYLRLGQRRVDLEGLQLGAVGRSHAGAAQLVSLSGFAFAPLSLVGFAVEGGDVVLDQGTRAVARLSNPEWLSPLGPAPYTAASPAAGAAGEALAVPPPPPGKGQVVFFRRRSLLGVGQWFNVREDGVALGKLTNGAWFVAAAALGLHSYTASTEPEFKDHLTLDVAAGETYFVEGTLTKGLIIGAADLSPSDAAAFQDAAGALQSGGDPTAAAVAKLAEPADGANSYVEGYGWATQSYVGSPDDCPPAPAPFRAGCLARVAKEAGYPPR